MKPRATLCRVALVAAIVDIEQMREFATVRLLAIPGVSAVQAVDLSPMNRSIADAGEAAVELLVTSDPCPERDMFVCELLIRDSWYAEGYRGDQADADFFAVKYLHERVMSIREDSDVLFSCAGVHGQKQDHPEHAATEPQAL